MTPKTYKVAISIPNEGHTLPQAYDNHLVISYHLGALSERWRQEKRDPSYEFNWYTAGRLLTAMAREKLITEAIRSKMDYIFMYDDDMILPIDFFECMLYDMEEHPEIDILAPLAFMRNPPHAAVIYTLTEGYDPHYHRDFYINEPVRNYPRNALVECDAVGFGAVLIKMELFKRMKPPYCFSTTGSGEDIYLCHKAKHEAKARVFMDTRIKLGHIGANTIIDEEYYDRFNHEQGVEIPELEHKYNSYTK